MSKDSTYMQRALELAHTNLGQVWPNPAVGAVIVKDGKIIGEGATGRGGRPHAEPQALIQAGEGARSATLYVSLEPCAHTGQTPPCTDAIIAAGITKVVVACRDPDPRVNGAGITALRNAGIEVIENVLEKEARALNAGFFSRVERNRPWVTVKIATSKDMKITDPDNRWITGEEARNYGHRLRAENDAILTGIGTVLADDPELTCRLPGMENRSPIRIVLDRHNRLPKNAKILQQTANLPTWVMTEELPELLTKLSEKGITRLLVEGGKQITEAFLKNDLADELFWFQSDAKIGSSGLLVDLKLEGLTLKEKQHLGKDTLQILARF